MTTVTRFQRASCAGRLLLTCAVALAPAAGVALAAAPAQDREGQLERAQARISELFRFRVNVMLADLVEHHPLEGEALESVRESLHAAADAFTEEHPAKLQAVGSISWTATPILYEPFREFLASDGWSAALEGALSPEARGVLQERQNQRAEAVRTSLMGVMRAKLSRGLCLTEAELAGLDGVLAEAASEQIEDGLVAPQQNFYYGNQPADAFLELMKDAKLAGALEGERKELFETLLRKKRRTALHDLQFEVEYLLRGREDTTDLRRLLRGGADALLHRSGKELRSRAASLAPVQTRKNKDWDLLLRSVLELEDDALLEGLPSRSREGIQAARVTYLMAVLDERACFSAEQQEALLPLITKFVEQESSGGRGAQDPELLLPAAFRVSKDGTLIPGEDRFNQPSTKVKAMIKTFYETCTQDQRDVLES